MQLFAAAAERLVTALVGAGAEAVGRHAKSVHAKLGHGRLLDCQSSFLVVEGGEDLVGVLFRVVKSQAADCEIDDFMTVPRSCPG